jgi:uncharacterized phage protein gp47/JayE
MGLTLAQLLAVSTQEQSEADLIGLLDSVGFSASAWQAKSVPRTFLKWFAKVHAELTETVAKAARGMHLGLAAEITKADGTDDTSWLDLLLSSFYDEERAAAVSTIGKIVLTNNTGGAITVSAGQYWAKDAGGHLYENITGGVLAAPLGSVITPPLDWRAESPGAEFNIPNDAILPELATPVPGLVASNPAYGATGTWITTAGSDIESNASAKTRGSTKWATLGTGGPSLAYVAWARKGAPTVTRVKVDDAQPDGPNSLRVYLGNASGGATPAEVAAADAYIQPKKAAAAKVTTLAAANFTIQIIATIYVEAAYAATAPGQALDNLTRLQGELEIGGDVYRSEVLTALSSPTGVHHAVMSIFAGEFASIPEDAIAVFNLTLNVVLL